MGAATGAESWRSACKAIGVPPRRCCALVVTAGALQTALKAGLYCVAVPDIYSEFQDFAGADMVLDSLKDFRVAALHDIMYGCAFR